MPKDQKSEIEKNVTLSFLEKLLQDKPVNRTRYGARRYQGQKIEDKITEKEIIKNEGLRQDIKLKKITLIILFGFLVVETIAVFVFSFFQAVNYPHDFHLEEWSFKLLISATISQITIMLIIAVNHLFPKQK